MAMKRAKNRDGAKIGKYFFSNKFESPDEFDRLAEEYFQYCDDNNKPYTITGLACYLDVDRTWFFCHDQEGTPYFDAVKRAKQRILRDNEEKSIVGKYNTTFMIFSLKNNFGWSDKQDVNVNANVKSPYSELTEEELKKLAKGK